MKVRRGVGSAGGSGRRASPSVRRSRARDGADAAERILAAALSMFADRGYDGASTRDIAARAGVNLGLLQYYFGGKEKLWRAAVDRAFAALWEEVGGAASSARVETRAELAELLRGAVRFAARHPEFVRLMNDEGKRDGPRLRWIVDRHQRRIYEAVVALLQQARERGLVADLPPVHLYYVLIGAAGMLFSQAPECRRLAGADPTASPDMIEAHAEAVVQALLGPPR